MDFFHIISLRLTGKQHRHFRRLKSCICASINTVENFNRQCNHFFAIALFLSSHFKFEKKNHFIFGLYVYTHEIERAINKFILRTCLI